MFAGLEAALDVLDLADVFGPAAEDVEEPFLEQQGAMVDEGDEGINTLETLIQQANQQVFILWGNT